MQGIFLGLAAFWILREALLYNWQGSRELVIRSVHMGPGYQNCLEVFQVTLMGSHGEEPTVKRPF